MEHLPEIWHWTKQIAGVLFTTLTALYLIRCVSEFRIVPFLAFELYIDKLAKVIFC